MQEMITLADRISTKYPETIFSKNELPFTYYLSVKEELLCKPFNVCDYLLLSFALRAAVADGLFMVNLRSKAGVRSFLCDLLQASI